MSRIPRRFSSTSRRSPSPRQLRRAAARGRRRLAPQATAITTGAVVGAAALIGAGPAQASLPDAVPVAQVPDITLTAFDTTDFITTGELAVVNILRALTRIFDVNDLTPAQLLTDVGLGSLTPNELLSATGLGDVTLNELLEFGNLFGFGSNPVSVLLAGLGISESTTLSSEIDKLGLAGLPLSNFYDLIGMPDYEEATLSDLASSFGIGNDPVSNLFGMLGLTGDSTLSDAVQAFGIGDTQLDDLLSDWGVGGMHIGSFLEGLHVTPAQLFADLNINPGALPADIYSDGAFAPDATVAQFADATGLGNDTVTQLLSVNDLGGATLNEGLTGIGLQDDATVDQVLNTIGFNDLKIGDFLGGFGVPYGSGSEATLGDLFSAIPGFQQTTFGDLLGGLGLSGQSTINDLYTSIPGLGDDTLSDFVGDYGVGDTSLSDLADEVLGTTTIDQYLTDVMSALVSG